MCRIACKKTTVRDSRRLHTIILLIVVLVSLAFGICYPASLDHNIVAKELPAGALTPAQSKAIDSIVDLSHLMIGWAVALIGATVYLIKASFASTMQKMVIDLYLSVLIVIACIGSVYFGHLAIDVVAEMLSHSQFPVGNSTTSNLFGIQRLLLLSAIALFALQVLLTYFRDNNDQGIAHGDAN